LFRNRLTVALSMLLVGVGTVSSAATDHSVSTWAQTSTGVVDINHATVNGPAEDNFPLSIVVNLKLRNEDVMDSFIKEQHQPGSPAFHQWLSSEVATAHFSPTQEQAQSVADYLTAQGFTNVKISANRLLVSADGDVGTARRAFNTDFARVSQNGAEGIANVRSVQVPAAIAAQVQNVLGLQTVHGVHTHHTKSSQLGTAALPPKHDASHSYYLPSDLQIAYHVGTTPTGSNTAAAVVGWGSMANAATDLAQYETDAGIAKVPTNIVQVGASSTDTSGGEEWAMDAQAIVGISGGVKSLTFYQGTDGQDASIAAAINRVVTDNIAKVINMSFGECDSSVNGPWDTYFKTGVTQGQTFSASTGDWGSYGCGTGGQNGAAYGSQLGPEYPSTSPYVIAVGGTTLKTDANSNYTSESAWAWTGGGISTVEAKPSWQSALSGNFRQVPDIAFDADGNTGMAFYFAAGPSGAGYYAGGGTSLSSPLFVGSWARLESANNNGLGFAPPALYAYSGTFPFHDVTTGSNGPSGKPYSAGVGYDNTTGWGSFDIQAAATFITNNPGFVSDTNGGSSSGGGTPAANFSYVANGLTVAFTDNSTDAGGTISAHSWTFGDGSTSTATSPSHNYAAAGTYSVTETVTDSVNAKTSAKTASVTVTAPSTGGTPSANFSYTANGLTVAFTDSSTDTGGTISAHSWTFGDGGTSTATSPSHTYAAGGTYSVTETVTDSVNGKTSAQTASVTVTAPSTGGTPAAAFSVSTNGLTASFTDSSTDTGGTISAHSWTFGDGGTSTATSPSHTYASAGTYSVTETVTDSVNGKTSSATKSVTVAGGGVWSGSANNLSQTSGGYLYYSVVVPAGATNLKFVTSGGTGIDWLFVGYGYQPSLFFNDYSSENYSTSQSITIANPTAGTYGISLWAGTTFSGVNLTVTYNKP
jgi:subtilase family serine protease